jgi:hypothetical protein
MRYVPDYRNRPPLPPSLTDRHSWIIPLALFAATLINWG